MKNSLMTYAALLVVASSVVTSSALPENSRQKRQSCNDGRLCQCQNVLSSGAYRSATYIVQCLDALGVTHDFSADSTNQITKEICERYNVDAILGGQLRKCVFQKVGLIDNIKGVDQWNLPLIRNILIDSYTKDFPGEDFRWIRQIIITTFTVCGADPTDFEVFPFDDCWLRARRFILAIIEDAQSSSSQNLSSEGKNLIRNSDLSAELLQVTNEDIRRLANVDLTAVV